MEIPKIDNPTLYILIGVPGCGKSTWAKKHFEKNVGVCVSSDTIRKVIFRNENDQSHNPEVFKIAHHVIKQWLNSDDDVVFDATNIHKRYREQLIKEVLFEVNKPVRFVAIYFDTPIETCIARQELRDRKVPAKVIQKMARQMEKPTFEEGFDIIKTI